MSCSGSPEGTGPSPVRRGVDHGDVELSSAGLINIALENRLKKPADGPSWSMCRPGQRACRLDISQVRGDGTEVAADGSARPASRQSMACSWSTPSAALQSSCSPISGDDTSARFSRRPTSQAMDSRFAFTEMRSSERPRAPAGPRPVCPWPSVVMTSRGTAFAQCSSRQVPTRLSPPNRLLPSSSSTVIRASARRSRSTHCPCDAYLGHTSCPSPGTARVGVLPWRGEGSRRWRGGDTGRIDSRAGGLR